MLRPLIFLFLCFASLSATDRSKEFFSSSPFEISDLTSPSEQRLGGLINPLSGQVCLQKTDLFVPGAEPIVITRTYISPHVPVKFHNNFQYDRFLRNINLQNQYRGWELISHLKINYDYLKQCLYVVDQNGSILEFKNNRGEFSLVTSRYGMHNLGNGQSDPRNIRVTYSNEVFEIFLPDGTRRFYSSQYSGPKKLRKEILPNGKILNYTWDRNENLARIVSQDPKERFTYASINILRSGKKEFWIAPTGQEATYQFHSDTIRPQGRVGRLDFSFIQETPTHLIAAKSSFSEKETYTYADNLSIKESGRDSSQLSFSYEAVAAPGEKPHYRVNEVFLPSKVSLGRLNYDPPVPGRKEGSTIIQHANGTKSVYRFSKKLLLEEEKTFATNGSLKKKKVLAWDRQNRLQKEQLFDGDQKLVIQKEFQYDSFGNPILETISGDGTTIVITREFSQDGRNLLIRELDHKEVIFEYLSGTNLPTSKLTYDNGAILLKEFWTYDDCHNLIRKEKNEKITEYILRTEAPNLHMPEWIVEKYLENGEEKLLKKKHLLYDTHGFVCQEEIYDANSDYVYTLYKEFDCTGNLLVETNALGQTATYSYDINGNRLTETSFSGHLSKEFFYNNRDLLISERVSPCDADPITIEYTYNIDDQLIQKTINGANTTYITYDPVTKKTIEVKTPAEVKTLAKYDLLGRKVSHTNTKGNTTKINRNLFGAPSKITYPDQTSEHFIYNQAGHLVRHVNPEGLITTYERDIFGRFTKKRIGNTEESQHFNAFHLLQKTDSEGVTTTYTYDGAGRKIKEEKASRVKEYRYDSMGRLCFEKTGTLIIQTKYDLLDRIVEISKTDESNQVQSKERYTYDEMGNRSSITKFGKTETFSYDALNRITSFTDANGYTTTHHYDDNVVNNLGYNVLKKSTIDPKGLCTKILYDPYNRPVSKKIIDPMGTIIHQQERAYDSEGNLILEKENLKRTQQTVFHYDSNNRLITKIRGAETADERITHRSYTPTGCLSKLTDPNGVTLNYTYNTLGHLEKITSSDNNLSISYQTNSKGEILQAANDAVSLKRTYDSFGNLIKEEWSNGLYIEKSYDNQNRPLTLTFPEGRIVNEYDAIHLRKVKRLDSEGKILYEHQYDEFGPSGQIVKETLIANTGSIIHEYDDVGRKTLVSSPYFIQKCDYDPIGNLIQSTKNEKTQSYSYDELSQLTTEDDTTYSYDSLYNRIGKNEQTITYNDLNENESLNYDLNGNVISDGESKFRYDPLNQLILGKNEHSQVIIQYGPLGRRVSKTTNGMTETYLYDGENEFAAYDNRLKQLCVPGIRKYKDCHTPIAIELQGKLFVPILDAHDNIVKLVDAETKQVTHEYLMSAFGEELDLQETIFNPWRLSSKRYDPKLGLVYFGKRYYSPKLGHWMTHDPAGNLDSNNLYQYLLNNPFKYCDPDGQFVFMIAIPLAYISFEAIVYAVAATTIAATTAYYAHQAVPYVENWVNNRYYSNLSSDDIFWQVYKNEKPGDRGPPSYLWDDIGGDAENPQIEGFEWKGKGSPSDGKGNWHNEGTGESFHPDFDHPPPIHPHWDYFPDEDHNGFRLYPGNGWELRNEKYPRKL